MKKLLIAGTALITALSSTMSLADNHQPMIGGVEVFGCDFEDGKTMDDFMKVAAKWDKFADKNFSKTYEAHLMTHYYFNDRRADAYWVGFTNNHYDMGVTADEWAASGAKLQAEFDEVCPAKSHVEYSWLKVHNDREDQPISGGLVDFQRCNFREGATWEMLMAADAEMSTFMTKIGQNSRVYRWFPSNGARSDSPDFLQLTWNDSATDRGEDIVGFLANGGLEIAGRLYSNVVACEDGVTMAHTPLGGSQ